MARTKKRKASSTKRHHTSVKRRYAAPKRHHKVSHRRRRKNFGNAAGMKDTATTVAGVLAGMALTKIVVGALPASFTSSPIMRVLATAGAALLVGFGLKKVSPSLGAGAQLGGLAQAGSAAIDVVAPSLSSTFGLKGFFGPVSYTVPQNPIMAGARAALPPSVTPASPMSGFQGAFRRSF